MTLCVLVMVIDLIYCRRISLKPDHVENMTLKRQLQLYSHESGMFLCGSSIGKQCHVNNTKPYPVTHSFHQIIQE